MAARFACMIEEQTMFGFEDFQFLSVRDSLNEQNPWKFSDKMYRIRFVGSLVLNQFTGRILRRHILNNESNKSFVQNDHYLNMPENMFKNFS